MLGKITILNGNVLSRADYVQYRSSLSGESEDTIKSLMRRCETGETDFPPDFPERLFDLASSICEDIKRSGGEVDPCIEEQIHQHAHTEPETAPETLEVVRAGKSPSTEILIVEAAKKARLEAGTFTELREVFDFSDDLTAVRVKESAIVTPENWAALLGLSVDFGRKSIYLMGTAVNALMVMGHENPVVQICGHFGISYSALYNAAKMCRLVPPEKREGLYPSVVQEIAVRRYHPDDQKNLEIVLEMVEEAKKHGWTCEEARSNASARIGKELKLKKEPSKKELQERLARAEELLSKLLSVSDVSGTIIDLQEEVREFFGNDKGEARRGE